MMPSAVSDPPDEEVEEHDVHLVQVQLEQREEQQPAQEPEPQTHSLLLQVSSCRCAGS